MRQARGHTLEALSDVVEPGTLARRSSECFEKSVFPSLLSRGDLQNAPWVSAVFEHTTLCKVADALVGVDEAVTTSFRWLRAVSPGTLREVHMERLSTLEQGKS